MGYLWLVFIFWGFTPVSSQLLPIRATVHTSCHVMLCTSSDVCLKQTGNKRFKWMNSELLKDYLNLYITLILTCISLWPWPVYHSDLDLYMTLTLTCIWLWPWPVYYSDLDLYMTLTLTFTWLWPWHVYDSDLDLYITMTLTCRWLWSWPEDDSDLELVNKNMYQWRKSVGFHVISCFLLFYYRKYSYYSQWFRRAMNKSFE